jgi:predicted pyridoxine 5'-phosphate oxidase superfamily flavin-nucleotide-binding protein
MAGAVFHHGELTLQGRAGSRDRLAASGDRFIRPSLTEKQQAFFAQLPLVFIGGCDGQGRVWASVRFGQPGFIQAVRSDLLSLSGAMLADDPLSSSLHSGVPVALLGIAAEDRRRNRVNGVIAAQIAGGFLLAVEQAYGNCSKFIHRRLAQSQFREEISVSILADENIDLPHLSPKTQQMIAAADTFFIASLHPQQEEATHRGPQEGADISHRGGAVGFVQVVDAQTLIVPDYSGNQYFNTLGNLLLNPATGLVFIDYATGDILWISGRAEVIEDPAQVRDYSGAERLLRITVLASRLARQPLPIQWSEVPAL